jgi:hypothetical protein
MNSDDHAIVVGISNYPALGEGDTPLDLKGPENDADAITKWLIDPAGGHIPRDNIQIIKSSTFGVLASADNALPTILELEEALFKLDQFGQANGGRVGRRLYIYMSGHGFSPKRQRGCLYAANARERRGHNIHVSGWLEWLQDAGYFREFVLWMDCCMNRMSLLDPRDPPLPPANVFTPPGPTFIAFAAQRPLKAVEAPIPEDGGREHGVFTWTLLEGLRGAAADTNGRVTGHSLADWIRNAQKARMDPRDINDFEVAIEPEVVREDPGLIFARGVNRVIYEVTLSFPPEAKGKRAQLWAGAPPGIKKSFTVGPTAEIIGLEPGQYVLEVPEANLRHGFEVIGGCSVAVSERGQPIARPNDSPMFHLEIAPAEFGTEIFIIDSRFALVDRHPGRLVAPLPFGIFKVKTRLGRGIKEQIILLDGNLTLADPSVAQPLASAAPILCTALTHEYQVDAARRHVDRSRQIRKSGDRATLTVMARVWSAPDGFLPKATPWEGVTVVDQKGKAVMDLAHDGERDSSGDPFAIHTRGIVPGTYYLRQRLNAGLTEETPVVVEQSLVVPENWGLHVYILHRASTDTEKLSARPRISVLMRSLESGVQEADFEEKALESARKALADERWILNPELQELRTAKFRNPIAGILGAHLLLLDAEWDPSRRLTVLNEVVTNLRQLVGADHPDVEAISLRCPDPELRRNTAVRTPPMFQRSWKLLVEGCLSRPSLLPKKLWERALAQISLPPYFVWAADDELRATSRRELARATWAPTRAEGGPPPSTGPELPRPPSVPVRDIKYQAAALPPSSTPALAGRRRPKPSGPVLADRKLARQRALKLQVPASVLSDLAREYSAQFMDQG